MQDAEEASLPQRRQDGSGPPRAEHEENTKRVRRKYEDNTPTPPKLPACPPLSARFWWLWPRLHHSSFCLRPSLLVALAPTSSFIIHNSSFASRWLWWSFGGALRWLCTGFAHAIPWLSTRFVQALGGFGRGLALACVWLAPPLRCGTVKRNVRTRYAGIHDGRTPAPARMLAAVTSCARLQRRILALPPEREPSLARNGHEGEKVTQSSPVLASRANLLRARDRSRSVSAGCVYVLAVAATSCAWLQWEKIKLLTPPTTVVIIHPAYRGTAHCAVPRR